MESKLALQKETLQRLGGSNPPAAREGDATRRTEHPGMNIDISIHLTTTIFTIH